MRTEIIDRDGVAASYRNPQVGIIDGMKKCPQANILTINPPADAKIIIYKFESILPKIVTNYKYRNAKFTGEKLSRYHPHPLSEKVNITHKDWLRSFICED